MDTKQKTEQIIELAKRINELDAQRAAALEAMKSLIGGESAASAQLQPTPVVQAPTKPAKKPAKRRADRMAVATRERQMESFLRESPRTVSQIIKARIMPQGSVVYVLRRMLLKGTVTKDGAIYSLKVGV